MRSLVDSLLLLMLVCVPALAASCAGNDAHFRPGTSDVPPPTVSASASGSSRALGKWERFSELGGMKEYSRNFTSRGHGTGEWLGQIRGNEKASGVIPLLRGEAKMPAGAVLVELHNDKRTGAPLEGFVMEKREEGYFPQGGDWEYGVVTQDGTVQQRGKIEFCARCHAEAPSNFVFNPAPAMSAK